MKQKVNYNKLRMCRSCSIGYPIHELTHKLNLKQIIETEKQLERLNLRKDWFYHGDCEMYDLHILYEQNRVCHQCF